MKTGAITAAIVIAIVIVAGVGYYLLTRREVGPITKSPEEMALKSTDAPSGWLKGESTTWLSLDVVAQHFGTSVSNMQSWGYDRGVQQVFIGDNKSNLWSGVLRFSNVDGASKAFSQLRTVYNPERENTIPQKIGDECAGYTETVEYSTHVIIFRKANVVAIVSTFGPTWMFSFDDTIAYAKIVEGRIQ